MFQSKYLPSIRPKPGRVVALGTVSTLLLIWWILGTLRAASTTIPWVWPHVVVGAGNKSPSTCPPSAYANGTWTFRPRTHSTTMTNIDDALAFAGFEGCASSREYYWHLAADKEEQWTRFPNASSWRWTPHESCIGLEDLHSNELVRHLVEDGGWLLIGDSVTENHFFSLSCMLFPHVRATPDYTAGGAFDRAWPQHLFLHPSSPLIPSLTFPPNFNISQTPLVTFRRIDLLLSKAEISTLHRSTDPLLPDSFSLFSDEPVWTLPVSEYVELFTADTHYGTMVVSTAGHWTTTLLSGLRDENKESSGYGIETVLELFEEAMKYWAAQVQSSINASGWSKRRQVVVRAYLPGHEDCHHSLDPWTEIKPFIWNWYNWASISEFNSIFEHLLSSKKEFPDIHFLAIDRPARLRPDAHATGDCLHIMTGAGVLEGWTHYIWHYVTHEIGR